jgi:hypothetical protein
VSRGTHPNSLSFDGAHGYVAQGSLV